MPGRPAVLALPAPLCQHGCVTALAAWGPRLRDVRDTGISVRELHLPVPASLRPNVTVEVNHRAADLGQEPVDPLPEPREHLADADRLRSPVVDRVWAHGSVRVPVEGAGEIRRELGEVRYREGLVRWEHHRFTVR